MYCLSKGFGLSDADIIGKNVTCALYEDQQTTKSFTIEGVTDENYYTALLGYPPTIIASDQVVENICQSSNYTKDQHKISQGI